MHNLNAESDQELISRTQKRDAHAFEILFGRYAPALHRHAAHILHDENAAHDVVQETFLRVWTRAEQYGGSGTFRAWLYRIATNLALNVIRTNQRRREIPLEIPKDPEDEDDEETFSTIPAWMIQATSLGPEAAVHAAMERSRSLAHYRHLLNSLSEDKREIVRMVHEMEMSLQDTADALDIPVGTVKSRLHYARKSLVDGWRKLHEGE